MQVIVNKEELMEPLAKLMLLESYKTKHIDFGNVYDYINKCKKQKAKTGLTTIDFGKVNLLLFEGITKYTDWLITDYKKNYRPLVNWLGQNANNIDIDSDTLLNLYREVSHKGFTKQVAAHIDPNFDCILAKHDDLVSDVLIRNVINNESNLGHRLQNKKDFWFTDAGYTNFLEAKGKPWHRLVRNHVHTKLRHLNFPADRLSLLNSMPRPWRNTGRTILVVESSDSHYHMFGTDRDTWRNKVVSELAQYTDRPVEYRSKHMDRKTRESVYDLLQSSDQYYCVISDCSAAALESVWAGVPIITLNTHITEPVARTAIADVENLYRGPVGDWLCALSYSQFTKKEMQNGTALRLVEKYHV